MNADELKSRILPILLSGTRRDNDQNFALGTDREHSVLIALSLAGQALRFTGLPSRTNLQ
jgi:hypothetical protein